MQDRFDLWHSMQDLYRTLFRTRRKVDASPPPIKLIQESLALSDYSASNIFSFMYILDNYDSTNLSTEQYRIRNCYDNPRVMDVDFENFTQEGLIEGGNVTARGRDVYAFVRQTMRPRWNVPLELGSEFDFILATMQRVHQAMLALPQPPRQWGLKTRAENGMKPQADALPLEHYEWQLYDLWAYRDDVHLEAWEKHGVSPFAWDALGVLWSGKADSPAKLAEVQKGREFSASEWAVYVQELLAKGWLDAHEDGTYTVNAAGKAVRDEAERLTDDYFYAAWQGISDEDIARFRAAIQNLKAQCEAILNS